MTEPEASAPEPAPGSPGKPSRTRRAKRAPTKPPRSRAFVVLLVVSVALAIGVGLAATSWELRSRFATLDKHLRLSPTTLADAPTLERLVASARSRVKDLGVPGQLQLVGEDVLVAVPAADAPRVRTRLARRGRVQLAPAWDDAPPAAADDLARAQREGHPDAKHALVAWELTRLPAGAPASLLVERELVDVPASSAWTIRDAAGHDALGLDLDASAGAILAPLAAAGRRVALLVDGRVVLAPRVSSTALRFVVDGGPAGFEPGEVDDLVASLRFPHPCDVVALRE